MTYVVLEGCVGEFMCSLCGFNVFGAGAALVLVPVASFLSVCWSSSS